MSTSKQFDKICLAVVLCAILVTGLFMNGTALGIQPMTAEQDDYFTANDLNAAWDTAKATRIELQGDTASVHGNGAYFANGALHIVYAGSYVISGELTDGSIVIDADGDDKIWVLLDGVNIYCSDSAALHIEQAGKVFLTLAEGTENTFSAGASYCESAVSRGVDGAVYARDDLTINGNGQLIVTAAYQHGIVCNDDLVITGGKLTISAPVDGIHANDSVRIAEAVVDISAKDDGITVSNDDGTDFLYLASGSVKVNDCYEGLEATTITIKGGNVELYPTDDGINAEELIDISGGKIRIINLTGRDADGLDSNKDIVISGGELFISVNGNAASSAIDYGSERGGTCRVDGGTIVACGGTMMLETMSEDSQQPFVVHTVSGEAGTRLILRKADGTELVNEIVPAPFDAVTLSLPEVKLGEVCTLIVGDTEEEITMDNSAPEGFGGFGGMGGHGMKGEMPAFDPENLPEDWKDRIENRGERPEWAGGERQPHQRPPEKQQ